MRYALIQTVSEVRRYEVELPDGATQEQIRSAALDSDFKVKWAEVQDVEIVNENGKTINDEGEEGEPASFF